MKPYLVHKTWIDLDHVVAIPTSVEVYDPRVMYGGNLPPNTWVDVQFLFRSKPVCIQLGDATDSELAGVDPMRAQKVLDDLIAAWKAKDDNVHVTPPTLAAVNALISDWAENRAREERRRRGESGGSGGQL